MSHITTVICPHIIRRYNPENSHLFFVRGRGITTPSPALAIRRTRRHDAYNVTRDASCASQSGVGEKHDIGLRSSFHWGGRRSRETNDSWEKFLPFPRSPRRGGGRVPVSDFLINFTRINTNAFIFCAPRSQGKNEHDHDDDDRFTRSLCSFRRASRTIPSF